MLGGGLFCRVDMLGVPHISEICVFLTGSGMMASSHISFSFNLCKLSYPHNLKRLPTEIFDTCLLA